MDWHRWHKKYDIPDSPIAQRLKIVQQHIRVALDKCPPGPLRIVSVCAGQGRDLLDVLAEHPRGSAAQALLIDLDERNTSRIKKRALSLGLSQIHTVTGDASLIDHYDGMAPAHLVLLCGLFGNITDEDIQNTVSTCSQLCRTDGAVIWTRNRNVPDKVPLVCEWFEAHDFEREWLSDDDPHYGVGTHRFRGCPHPIVYGTRMFTFVGSEILSRQHSISGSENEKSLQY
tara:strand:+ start:196 stop:882 length:687 start_codon:yes stop_codon:yes gene_type:complete